MAEDLKEIIRIARLIGPSPADVLVVVEGLVREFDRINARQQALFEYIKESVAVIDPERACGETILPEPEVCDARGCDICEREDCDELISQAKAFQRLKAVFDKTS